MNRLILIFTLLFFSFAFLNADVYIKNQKHSSAIRNQPERNEISEQWITTDKMANISPQNTMIIDLNKKKFYMVYHTSKSYVEADLPMDILKLVPDQYAATVKQMKTTVSVKSTRESKKIGRWNCQGYEIDMKMAAATMKIKSWATQDVSFDWKNYRENILPGMISAAMPFLDEKGVNQFKTIDGFQVSTEMIIRMLGQEGKVTGKVLEISEKEAPPGTYSVPNGYTRQDKLNMRL